MSYHSLYKHGVFVALYQLSLHILQTWWIHFFISVIIIHLTNMVTSLFYIYSGCFGFSLFFRTHFGTYRSSRQCALLYLWCFMGHPQYYYSFFDSSGNTCYLLLIRRMIGMYILGISENFFIWFFVFTAHTVPVNHLLRCSHCTTNTKCQVLLVSIYGLFPVLVRC